MMAVLMPITSPRASTSGPPELPGFSSTSVWMMFSISLPFWLRSDLPNAEMTPAETVFWKPKGLPMPKANCPTRRLSELPSLAVGRFISQARITARSVAGSVPTVCVSSLRPSISVTLVFSPPSITWLLVRI